MNTKKKLGAFVSGAGKAAKGLIDSAVHAADQNNDGKFNMEDVSAIAGTMGNALKKGAHAVKDSAEEKAKIIETNTLRPIFPDSLNDSEFVMPKFVRLIHRDKKHANSEVCQGSIGYDSSAKQLEMVTVFIDSVDVFGLTFYPDQDGEFYYVDPSDRNRYIALDEYFNYLKVARVNELQKIAQDLGAKYFKVTYKEEQTSFSEKKIKAHGKSAVASADTEYTSEEKKYYTIGIAAENSFAGHEPIKPVLNYMQRDPSIQALVAMRMDEKAPLIHQKYMLKMSTSSGIKENDAAKIDAVLKGLKLTGNATVASEARNESRRYLEYEIEF